MKSIRSRRHWCSLVVALLVLGGTMTGGAPVFAAGGTATSSATPSNATPGIGDSIVVTIAIDVSGVAAPDNALGSFTGALDWDPAVLTYSSNSGIQAGFTGVANTGSAGTGHIVFNGAKPAGATGNNTVLTITFDVVGAGTSALDLGYSAMSAASTFANLLPLLTVTDGQVAVSPAAHYSLTLAVDPVGGGTTDPALGPHAYASGSLVDVTATAASAYEFDHWGGACAGAGACQVTMSADNTVTAYFTEIPLDCYNLTLSHTGQGSDPVADPTHSIDCPSGRYTEGETIELSGASPDAGWRTSGWAGTSQTNSTADTNSLTMPASAHVATVMYKVYVEIPAIFGGAASGGSALFQPTIKGDEAISASASSPDTQSVDSTPSGVSTQQIARQQDMQDTIEVLPTVGPNKVVESSHSEPDIGGTVSNPPMGSTQQAADEQPLIAKADDSNRGDSIPIIPHGPRVSSSRTVEQRSSTLPLLLVLGAAVVVAALAVLVGLALHRIKYRSAGGE